MRFDDMTPHPIAGILGPVAVCLTHFLLSRVAGRVDFTACVSPRTIPPVRTPIPMLHSLSIIFAQVAVLVAFVTMAIEVNNGRAGKIASDQRLGNVALFL
jgi:hypothetical protein